MAKDTPEQEKPQEEPKEEPQTSEPTEDQQSDQAVLDDILSKPSDSLIPWEKVTLPSGGVYYDGKIPNGEIEVRGWGIQTDKILATSRLAQSGQSLNHVYKNCIRLPDEFDHMNLLVGDRMFLLYYLRGITYGNEYEFLVECGDEDCGHAWPETYDMNLLAKTITGPNPDIGLEPFKVVLPYFSEYAKREFWVKIRLLRGYDLDAIIGQKRVSRKMRSGIRSRSKATRTKSTMSADSLDKTIEDNLRMVIVEAMGDRERRKIDQLVSKMHAKDTATIREFLRDNTPGVDASIEVECPECSNVITMDLPITESFFRPSGPGGPGK